MTKGQLRRRFVRVLKQQREGDRRRRSEAIRQQLDRLTAFRRARVVCCYVALPYEVQTWQLIEAMLAQGKRVAVPRSDPMTQRLRLSEVRDPAVELERGAFGVWEPVPEFRRPLAARALDLVLVPGLAFDRRGARLGHGHGYYDRFLARLPERVPTIGLAFRFQLLDRLPTTSHDHAVRAVVTA